MSQLAQKTIPVAVRSKVKVTRCLIVGISV